MRLPLVVCAVLLAFAANAQSQYDESIVVSRALVPVRVLGMDQKPVEGLPATDFLVTLAGRSAEVLSARWVEDSNDSFDAGNPYDPAPQGRLFVLFIQTDWARSNLRTTGQMAFRRYAEQMIRNLAPEDRVAVFSFDSHLKFRRDFTTPDDAAKAIAESLRTDRPPLPPKSDEVSLIPLLDPDEMKRAADSETGLLIIAKALARIDRPKTMFFLGWGFDSSKPISAEQRWPAAVARLRESDVAVFSISYTGGKGEGAERLKTTSSFTGGTFTDGSSFPQQAVNRIAAGLAGYYELELRVPEGVARGEHPLRVRVAGRNVYVHHPEVVFTN